jgi:hypothetical protein
MKKAAWFSMAVVLLFCPGCSAIGEENQYAQSRRFSGRLILLVADNFAEQSSEIHYKLQSNEDGRTFSLQFSNPKEIPDANSGAWVEIIGRQRNGRIDVETLRIIPPLEETEKN